jgi:glutathione S-transferase
MLKYYHAEPLANSLKSMIPLFEKALPFESIYVDLHKFEQHSAWFIAINPEGQVPVLDHDGVIITHTTVINEYLEDVFPDVPLRPRDPEGAARMRYWNKFVADGAHPFARSAPEMDDRPLRLFRSRPCQCDAQN